MSMHASLKVGIGFVIPLAMMQGGCSNVLGFGTATKFGLDIAQRADQTIDASMGYDRVEIASIPAPKNEDAMAPPDGADTYSVLGTFSVEYGNPWASPEEPLVLDQFFATGWAARIAAKSPKMQDFFGKKAHEIVTKKPESE